MSAETCIDSCDDRTTASATYTIVPPPPPAISVDPASALANQNFGLRYTVFDEPCPFTSAQFYWDGSPLGPPVPLDSGCSAPWFEDVAPSPNDVGPHTVAAEGCDVTCDPSSRASATYTILAPPTLVLTPTSGVAGAPFTATYQLDDDSCDLGEARFYWDGDPIADVALGSTCAAVLEFPVAPFSSGPGTYTVSADTCLDSCDIRTRASATYTVDPPPPPSLTADPTSGLPTAPFTVTYDFGQTPCAFGWIEFAWDGVPVGTVDVDSGCTATLSLTSAPDPATLGVHELTGLPCASTFCDTASLATTTYTIVAPPADPEFSVDPTEGLAGQPLGLHFSTNQTPCPYTTAQFFWDGAPIEAPVALDASCSAVLFLDVAPAPDGVGMHVAAAEACAGTCDSATTAVGVYEVLAPPTLVVAPTSGLAGAAFTATYHINDSGCSWTANFEWDGVVVASEVDLSTCTAVYTFPAAPAPNGVGPHTVSAVNCLDGCDPLTRVSVTYTVLAPADPTIVLDPTSGLADQPFAAQLLDQPVAVSVRQRAVLLGRRSGRRHGPARCDLLRGQRVRRCAAAGRRRLTRGQRPGVQQDLRPRHPRGLDLSDHRPACGPDPDARSDRRDRRLVVHGDVLGRSRHLRVLPGAVLLGHPGGGRSRPRRPGDLHGHGRVPGRAVPQQRRLSRRRRGGVSRRLRPGHPARSLVRDPPASPAVAHA